MDPNPLNYLESGKTIVKNLTHSQDRVCTIVYRRRNREHVRGRARGASREKDKQTDYIWERVTGDSRQRCRSWQVVQFPRQLLKRIPRLIPIWKDDPSDGKKSSINFERVDFNAKVNQAPLVLVSALMGERISDECHRHDLPVWFLEDQELHILDKNYTLGLIDAKTFARKKNVSLDELLNMSAKDLGELGMSNEAMFSIDLLACHRKAISEIK